MTSMEDRIVSLETSVALSDRTVEKLSEAVMEQQKLIDILERKVETLAAQLRAMDVTSDSGEGTTILPPR